VPLQGDTDGPIFEAWELLAAWGALTKRVHVGTLVTGATYRHPAVLANMVATLDHVTNGRAILGLGAAWHEAEHRMYGIPFLTTGGRLARLAESAEAMRMLLDQPFATFKGKYVKLTNATCEPKPVQKRLPLLVGGGGERKTLRIVARFADYWHGHGTPEVIAHKIAVIAKHCAEVGRDPAEITPITTVRDVDRLRTGADVDAMVGKLVALWRAGARGFIHYSLAPYDHETIRLVAREVRPRFEGSIASGEAA